MCSLTLMKCTEALVSCSMCVKSSTLDDLLDCKAAAKQYETRDAVRLHTSSLLTGNNKQLITAENDTIIQTAAATQLKNESRLISTLS